jgi:enhancer of mRNA-decapping protein 3
MLELEQLATSELGLTEEMMTENAARSIAETAYNLSTTEDEEHPGRWSTPLVVILAGNHKTGSRAIASARHLRNHGARVILCILGLEREDDLLDSVRRQLKVFRNCGGQAIKQDGLIRTLRKLQAPTDLIVDALLGMHVAFDDLRTDDQASYFQLIFWANSSDAATLSLDVPSGIDASTGMLTSHDSQPLHLHAAHILSLGAPKTGLLTALERVEGAENLGLYVADIGISPSAWKKFGTRRRHGVEFGGDWVVAIQYESREKKAKVMSIDGRWPRWL